MDKISSDARVYTNVQGLEELRIKAKTDPNAAKKEVAQQFEALLLQMVLRSMRDANAAFSSDATGGNEMAMYTDMFDKQLTLAMSERGSGFAQMIEQNINNQMHLQPELLNATPTALTLPQRVMQANAVTPTKVTSVTRTAPMSPVANTSPSTPKSTAAISTPKEFVHQVWQAAKQAAKLIGVHPGVLVAQAALETDWGKKIIAKSNNLFNIKANADNHQKVSANTLEYKNGVIVKETANFKKYDNISDSMMDYAQLIKQQPRYEKAVQHANHPSAYARELQAAGFATDTHYANKIIAIMESDHFKSIMAEMT